MYSSASSGTMDKAVIGPCSSAGPVVEVCFPSVRASILDNLNQQREEGQLCDLSILVQGQVFRAHRCVLAASSPYFHDQVVLKNVTSVTLPSVLEPLAVQSVLDSAYTGQLRIMCDDIVNYVTVASFLQMWHIVDKCTEILKRSRPVTEGSLTETLIPQDTSSRQQSPSSSDCCTLPQEGGEEEKRQAASEHGALPPLATWRRPQQFSRWSRNRPVSCQNDYGSAEEKMQLPGTDVAWTSSYSTLSDTDTQPNDPTVSKARSHFKPAAASTERHGLRDRGTEADEGVGEDTEQETNKDTEKLRQTGERQTGECEPGWSEERIQDEQRETYEKNELKNESSSTQCDLSDPHRELRSPAGHFPQSSARLSWPWSQHDNRLQEGEEDCGADEEGEVEEGEMDFGRFTDTAFDGETYDEIEDGTGQVSQRPLLPVSPDATEFVLEQSWPQFSRTAPPSLPLNPTQSSPPSSSPPIPSSSSPLALAGAPYTGKVHFCHCGKAYTQKSMRDRHVKMQHLNLRPFTCPVCTKSFKMKHHLTKHLKTHGGLRPYECRLCGKKVIWRDSFLRHQARCERLVASGTAVGYNTSDGRDLTTSSTAGTYSTQECTDFLPQAGLVKVEQSDSLDDEASAGGLFAAVTGSEQELAVPEQILKQEKVERGS
ncbi:zinc finger and BTB domain-containing protein 22 [Chanos chanos]|uniref:Zinc finger and BTB domain-containing protein 22 n=1 Tax=Chanos chanos TaxID=29144 RepID=A0A6J2WH37_CHACN|nr:zinc finger and BTB domain-containing protein 22-like [Chanos chanos]